MTATMTASSTACKSLPIEVGPLAVSVISVCIMMGVPEVGLCLTVLGAASQQNHQAEQVIDSIKRSKIGECVLAVLRSRTLAAVTAVGAGYQNTSVQSALLLGSLLVFMMLQELAETTGCREQKSGARDDDHRVGKVNYMKRRDDGRTQPAQDMRSRFRGHGAAYERRNTGMMSQERQRNENRNQFAQDVHAADKTSKPKAPKRQPPVASKEPGPIITDPFWKALNAEANEYVLEATETPADQEILRYITSLARRCIQPVIPEAEVHCVGTGNMSLIHQKGGKPELDMIIKVDLSILYERLKQFFLLSKSRQPKSIDTLRPERLEKTATRFLSKRLTFVRFGRSEFSGPVPMVYLVVPESLKCAQFPIRMSFSVNCVYPVRLQTLMSKDSNRAKELIILVIRWARLRHVASQAKGLIHVYAWGLLVLYFLRTRRATSNSTQASSKSPVELFEEFAIFYSERLDREDERLVVSFSGDADIADGQAAAGIPVIEDPFQPSTYAAPALTARGVVRIKEELSRAIDIFSRRADATLAELMEPCGADAQASDEAHEGQDDEGDMLTSQETVLNSQESMYTSHESMLSSQESGN